MKMRNGWFIDPELEALLASIRGRKRMTYLERLRRFLAPDPTHPFDFDINKIEKLVWAAFIISILLWLLGLWYS